MSKNEMQKIKVLILHVNADLRFFELFALVLLIFWFVYLFYFS